MLCYCCICLKGRVVPPPSNNLQWKGYLGLIEEKMLEAHKTNIFWFNLLFFFDVGLLKVILFLGKCHDPKGSIKAGLNPRLV